MKRLCLVLSVMVASLMAAVLPVGAPAGAQSGGPYELSWGNMGAGGTSSGGAYALSSAVGQPDAHTLSGGQYQLGGGFLAGASIGPRVYVPIVRR